MDNIFQDIGDYIRVSKDAIDLFKTARGLLPAGTKREEIDEKIAAIGEDVRVARIFVSRGGGKAK